MAESSRIMKVRYYELVGRIKRIGEKVTGESDNGERLCMYMTV